MVVSIQDTDQRVTKVPSPVAVNGTANKKICVVVVSNDEQILARNLLSSNMIRDDLVDLRVIKGAQSASIGYNKALDESQAEIVVFAHQDVYFPPGWERCLLDAIGEVERIDLHWALIAPIGISNSGELSGEVWSTSQGGKIGCKLDGPEVVQSVDELLIVLRRDSGIRFDNALPTFHLYGTDIVQSALSQNMGAFACQLPVVHNDRFHENLGPDFGLDYRFVRLKWLEKLPIRTTVLQVTRAGLGLFFYRLRAWWSRGKRGAISADSNADPRTFSASCGWEGN